MALRRLAAGIALACLLPVLALTPPARAQERSTAKRQAAAEGAAGKARAQYDEALALLCGSGRPRNAQAAAQLLEAAARQGHVAAQGLLGWMAMSGTGMPRDDALAASWLRRAAEAGNTAAQNNLGVLHALGSGVAHDHAQAERWFRAAADKGAEDAARNLEQLLRVLPPAAGSAPVTVAPMRHPTLATVNCGAGKR